MSEQQRPDVRALAGKVAAELGEGWTAVDGFQANGSDAMLCGPDDEQVLIRAGGWRQTDKGRLRVVATMDTELHRHVRDAKSNHSIGLSHDKTAQQVARDIERRLLPGYRDVLAQARERKQRHDEGEAARAALLDNLAEALSIPEHFQPSHRPHVLEFGNYGHGINGSANVQGDRVDFELRVPRAVALDLAAEIGRLYREGKADV